MPPPRIAIGAIFTECNHLGGLPIDVKRFEQYELYRGNEINTIDSGVVGGMLQVLRHGQMEPVPLLFASTCPGGPLTSACYRQLKTELLERLQTAGSVNGVLLPLHGAATVEDVGDLEGDLIRAVRDMVGPTVPIVVTVDLHAHVTADMVRHADAILAWETYPHRDSFTTGQRGARLLGDILDGRCRPAMAMAKVPVITGAINGSTEGDDPFAHLMHMAKSFESESDVLSTSVFLVHPTLDLPEMGSGGLVITDNDMDRAISLARRIADEYWNRRFELEPKVVSPSDAIAKGLGIDGSVLLVETADCCGGGAAGDSVATLSALLDAGVEQPALVPVVDPDVAAVCHERGTGAQLSVELGHKLDPRWGNPINVTGRVVNLTDGRFQYVGGIWENLKANMGPSAVLEIGSIQVLVSTHATYDWADEQFRAMGIEPSASKFIVAKNPMNYRNVYLDIAKAVFILDTPGPTPATVRSVDFKNLRRPYFPLDVEIPGLTPTILQ